MLQSNSAQRILEHARTRPLDFPPGSKYSYSNTGYNLLAAIIERVAQRPFRAFVRERVLAPAGLSGMTFVSRGSIIPRLASAYIRSVDSLPVLFAGITLDERTLQLQPALPLDGPHGDGALVSDARNLWRWTEALADSTALAPASIRELMTPGMDGYAEGWVIGERFKRRTASHSGWLPGYVSLIEWYPASRTTIVVLSNVEGTRTTRIMRDLAAITFGEPYDTPVARRLVPFDSAGSAPLAGRYVLTDGDTAVVSLERELVIVEIPRQFKAGLFPLGGDKFYAPFFENVVLFQRDANGRGASIVLKINGVPRAGVRRG
jgi:CubicO group peptidase (beta-lactamase class C family)